MPSTFLPEKCQGLISREEATRASTFISGEITALSAQSEPTQIRRLLQISGSIGNFFGADELDVHLGWILEHHRVWMVDMSSSARHRYLTELVAWRSLQGANDGMWMAYFLPGIHLFQQCPPEDTEPSLNNNWFVWWFREGQSLDITPSQDSITEGNRTYDKWFMDYLAFRDEHGSNSTAEMPIRDYSSRRTDG